MKQEQIHKIINETVNTTVLKMKMAGLVRNNRRTALEKTEELLRNYNTFKEAEDEQEYTRKIVLKIENALNDIKDDAYYKVIEMYYFKNNTREEIAEKYKCSEATISRNKTRLMKILSAKLFSDDIIFELFL